MIIIVVGKNSEQKERFISKIKVDKVIKYKQIDKVKANNHLSINNSMDVLIDGEFLCDKQINHISNIAKSNAMDYTVISQWDTYTYD
jgi:uncharacterized protein YueI